MNRVILVIILISMEMVVKCIGVWVFFCVKKFGVNILMRIKVGKLIVKVWIVSVVLVIFMVLNLLCWNRFDIRKLGIISIVIVVGKVSVMEILSVWFMVLVVF